MVDESPNPQIQCFHDDRSEGITNDHCHVRVVWVAVAVFVYNIYIYIYIYYIYILYIIYIYNMCSGGGSLARRCR